MAKSPPKKETETEAQIEKRRDNALMRALSMPPKPHKTKKPAEKKKK